MQAKIKILLITLLIILSVGLTGCNSNSNNNEKITVAVSIAPQEAFVKAVAKDLVDVVVLIPPGASPTNYLPTPKQLIELSESDIYFQIGVPTEVANIEPNILANSSVKSIKLHQIVNAVYRDRFFEEDDHGDEDHVHQGRDPHIWLSVKRVIVMIESIKDNLIELDPDNKEKYIENATAFINELNLLDTEIKNTTKEMTQREFIIMHPSLGYFADDYNLHMHAIEEDGKNATVERIKMIIDIAREEEIKVIFYQAEFDSAQAKTIADEIGGQVVEIEPLSSNYIDNMRAIVDAFKER